MKKVVLVLVIIALVGIVVALAGFALSRAGGVWVDRDGVHVTETARASILPWNWGRTDIDRGKLVSVDESYQSFANITIEADYFDRITLKEGDGYAVRGQNYEGYGGLDVRLDGDSLVIESKAERFGKWVSTAADELFRKGHTDVFLEVTYPKGAELGNVRLSISAADVKVSGVNCEELYAGNSYGDVGIEYVQAAGLLTARLSAGDLKLEGVFAETISVENSFGKVEVNGAEAESLSMSLSAGDLSGRDVKAGDLKVNNSVGTVGIDGLEFTGLSEVNNSAGDIDLRLKMDRASVSYDLHASVGSVYVDDSEKGPGGSVSSGVAGAGARLEASASVGTIRVRFVP